MGYENPHFVSKADLYASRDEWRRKYLDLFNEAGDYKDRAEQAEAREDAWVNEEQIQRTRAEQAEASLAAERELRCDECESREGSSHYCLLWTINTPDEHYCRDWTARDSGGGAS